MITCKDCKKQIDEKDSMEIWVNTYEKPIVKTIIYCKPCFKKRNIK